MKFFNVVSVEEAKQLIKEKVPTLNKVETIPIEGAVGKILAEDIFSHEQVPAFKRSSVDGYAVKAKDTFGASESMPAFLTNVGKVEMGVEASKPIQFGEAMYVPTGGMLPEGSDSMVMIEHCEEIDDLLNIYRQVAPRENVIFAGEDIDHNQLVLSKGTELGPQHLAALGGLGIYEICVYQPVKIGYFSTGNEIVPYTTKELPLGKVRDMNALIVGQWVKKWNAEFVYGGIISDSFEELQNKAKEMLQEVDFLLLSGGSSVGTKDYTVEVMESLGEPGLQFHGISIKPGKPTIFSLAQEKPILGLPGHPASAFIIFFLFGKEVIYRLRGEEVVYTKKSNAILTKNLSSTPGRTDYIRVKLFEKDQQLYAEPILGKSGLISTLLESNGILEISSEREGYEKGNLVPVYLF
ncbi:molybdopterin molybdotransferase MoeA [Bacillaceae bacterium S4-13-58]